MGAEDPAGLSGVEESDESDDDGARASPRAVSSEDSDSESEGEEEEESEDLYSDAT